MDWYHGNPCHWPPPRPDLLPMPAASVESLTTRHAAYDCLSQPRHLAHAHPGANCHWQWPSSPPAQTTRTCTSLESTCHSCSYPAAHPHLPAHPYPHPSPSPSPSLSPLPRHPALAGPSPPQPPFVLDRYSGGIPSMQNGPSFWTPSSSRVSLQTPVPTGWCA